MNEEKRIGAKEIIKALFGNKWLYLIMAAAFFAISFVGLNLMSSARKQYVAFFDYNVPGLTTIVDEDGNQNTYYIDGEKFVFRSIITREKLKKYFAEHEELNSLNADELYSNNVVASFSFKIRYKKNDHKMDDKDAAYVEDKRGYELVLNSHGLNAHQAEGLAYAIANEVLEITKTKLDKIRYSQYINAYDRSNSYLDKIQNLIEGVNYLKEQSTSLKDTYGDVALSSDFYGGESDAYYLDSQTLSTWQNSMNVDFGTFYLDSLANECANNGYVNPNYTDYISSLKTQIENLTREISINDAVRTYLETERNTLLTSVKDGTSVESLEIGEYNAEIVSLTKIIEEQNEQLKMLQNELKNTDTSSLSPSELAAYNANLSNFEGKLSSIREKLGFYTAQYEAIAKKTMKENMSIYFDKADIISTSGGFSTLVILGGSIAVGVFAPMAVNLAWLCFKTADGKPIFKFKKNEDSLK